MTPFKSKSIECETELFSVVFKSMQITTNENSSIVTKQVILRDKNSSRSILRIKLPNERVSFSYWQSLSKDSGINARVIHRNSGARLKAMSCEWVSISFLKGNFNQMVNENTYITNSVTKRPVQAMSSSANLSIGQKLYLFCMYINLVMYWQVIAS